MGLGEGVVILYGKLVSVMSIFIVVGRIKKFVEWELFDDKLVNIIIFFVVKNLDVIIIYIKLF